MTVTTIFDQYSAELRSVETELLGIFESPAAVIPLVGRHIVDSGGKRIRPLFLLLSADLCGYRGEDRALLGAIIEAIHTASLLHDDIIDEAETRRGKPSANTVWGNQIVVLVGDFLYSNALRLAVDRKNQKIMEALSEATTRMTEGELLQLHKTGDPDITTEEYFKIIAGKTGVLIAAACKIGAVAAGVPEQQERALAEFGMKTGIAFQLADDILDYVAQQQALGKKLGKDLEEGKITMPLIHLLKVADRAERAEIVKLIEETVHGNGRKKAGAQGEHLGRITELFAKYRAIDESFDIARDLVRQAKDALAVFPPGPEKEALLAMADYTLSRKK